MATSKSRTKPKKNISARCNNVQVSVKEGQVQSVWIDVREPTWSEKLLMQVRLSRKEVLALIKDLKAVGRADDC